MIVPSSPGGPVDIVARAVGAGLAVTLGQQVVADNRAGAGGAIGAELVARATPDGHTVMISHSGPLAIEPLLAAKPAYDPLRDFAPVSLVAATPYLLVVHPGVPAKGVNELVTLARSRPGRLNYASGGPGTGVHMAAELLRLVARIDIVHVPYKGAGPGMTALLGQEVDLMFNGLPAVLPHVKAGRLRALAAGGSKRTSLLPELPTIAEGGLAFEASGWYGFVAPRDTPGPVVGRLHAGLGQALAASDMRERLAALGIEPIASTPQAFAAYLRGELDKWGKVIKASGAKAG